MYELPSCGNVIFPCSVDPEQDWQPYPADPYSAMCNKRTYLHLSLRGVMGGRKRRGRRGILPAILFHFFHPIKGHLQLFSTFFRPRNFHILVVFCFCFAVCHKEWPRRDSLYFQVFPWHFYFIREHTLVELTEHDNSAADIIVYIMYIYVLLHS